MFFERRTERPSRQRGGLLRGEVLAGAQLRPRREAVPQRFARLSSQLRSQRRAVRLAKSNKAHGYVSIGRVLLDCNGVRVIVV